MPFAASPPPEAFKLLTAEDLELKEAEGELFSLTDTGLVGAAAPIPTALGANSGLLGGVPFGEDCGKPPLGLATGVSSFCQASALSDALSFLAAEDLELNDADGELCSLTDPGLAGAEAPIPTALDEA